MPAGSVLRGDFVFAIMLVMRCGRRILLDRVNATKPPGVQERDEADLGTQVFRISGDRAQDLGAGAKQDVVKRFLILVGKRRDRFGQSKDHMEVLDLGEQFGLAVFKPLGAGKRLTLGTMPIPARNGVHSITCLMGSFVLWGEEYPERARRGLRPP